MCWINMAEDGIQRIVVGNVIVNFCFRTRLLGSKELYRVELVVSQPNIHLCPNYVGVMDCLFSVARN